MAFIVNRTGAVHQVADEALSELVKREGFREAKQSEVSDWWKAQGLEPPKAKKEEAGS